MRPLTRRWRILGAALIVGVLGTSLERSGRSAEAAHGATSPTLQAQAGSLTRAESAALLQLYAAESSLARAQADLARLEARSARLAVAEHDAHRRAQIVRRSLEASRARVAALLRALYVQGEPDPIAVVLGASSLDEVMAGIDGLARATAMNKRLGLEAAQRQRRLETLQVRLASQRKSLASARLAARSGTLRLAAAVAGRRGTLASLRRQRDLTVQRLTALESKARAAQKKSEALAAPATETATAVAGVETAASTAPSQTQAPAGGTRTLVVDAVAYHLPGHTASGLPVGVGVIAVDPAVIPLGTRMNIPGYGPAVAADVGSAVKGNIIDLWMPTSARARAWGRRTVTITIYG